MSKPTYGGQAVIEGVMMRGQHHYAVAVRDPQGEIVVSVEPLKGRIYTSRWLKMPLLRGPVVLWDTLALGMKSLMFSATVALSEEEEGEKVELDSRSMWGTMILALGFAVAVFFVGPAFVMSAFLDRFIDSALLSNVLEKVIRLGLVVGYIALIGRMPDIKRVFAYHGAEHKTIHAFEHGLPLDAKNASRFTTAHPRCGTSFLLVVFVISFIAFALLGQPPMLERLASRVVLIPVVAAVAYELIRLGARYGNHRFVRALMAPGMWLQSLTTREPDDSMLEVAIASLQHVLVADGVIEMPKPAPAREQIEAGVP
ncbi:MAG: DUF1385 domain-containing protein [Dehalococcoidales bacterium]|nr:DUF1385 domain-containing protein [Dehalococcoidales bacterium]